MSEEGFILSGFMSMIAIFAVTQNPLLAIGGGVCSMGVYSVIDQLDGYDSDYQQETKQTYLDDYHK